MFRPFAANKIQSKRNIQVSCVVYSFQNSLSQTSSSARASAELRRSQPQLPRMLPLNNCFRELPQYHFFDMWYVFQYRFREHSASFRQACGKWICWFTEKQYYFRSKSLGHICKTRKGLVVLEISKFQYLTCGQYPGWGHYPFRGASADLPQICYNEMDASFNMQFLYFLKGQLLIARIFRCKNEISRDWMIWRTWLQSICFRELPQRKNTKNIPRASTTAVRYQFPSFMTQSCISLCRK